MNPDDIRLECLRIAQRWLDTGRAPPLLGAAISNNGTSGRGGIGGSSHLTVVESAGGAAVPTITPAPPPDLVGTAAKLEAYVTGTPVRLPADIALRLDELDRRMAAIDAVVAALKDPDFAEVEPAPNSGRIPGLEIG